MCSMATRGLIDRGSNLPPSILPHFEQERRPQIGHAALLASTESAGWKASVTATVQEPNDISYFDGGP